MGAFDMDEGQRIAPNRRGICGDFPGACRVHPKLPGRDDMWGLHVIDRVEWEDVTVQERGEMGRRLDLAAGRFWSPEPFSFSFPFFLFCFSFVNFAKSSQIDSNQL
jgi:hypothetical protein